jgi:hypothetical protein
MGSAPQQNSQPLAPLHVPKQETSEHWKELCAQAAVEQDPARLIELVQEINRLLAEKDPRQPFAKGIT